LEKLAQLTRQGTQAVEPQPTITDERLQNLEEKLAQLTRQGTQAVEPQPTITDERLQYLEKLAQLTQQVPQVVEPQPTVIRVSVNSDCIPEFIPGQTNQSPTK
jgi:hypothetical protein